MGIQDSICFCCQHNHVHPITKEAIPCDRELVYRTLKQWYVEALDEQSHETVEDEHYLAEFDKRVRVELRSLIGHRGAYMTYRNALVIMLPLLWLFIDIMARN